MWVKGVCGWWVVQTGICGVLYFCLPCLEPGDKRLYSNAVLVTVWMTRGVSERLMSDVPAHTEKALMSDGVAGRWAV